MTKKEFLIAFKEIRQNFDWCLINGCIQSCNDGSLFCPITAVCFCKTGNFHEINLFLEAGKEIGLKYNTAIAITKAADNDNKIDLSFRKELLSIVNLEHQ